MSAKIETPLDIRRYTNRLVDWFYEQDLEIHEAVGVMGNAVCRYLATYQNPQMAAADFCKVLMAAVEEDDE